MAIAQKVTTTVAAADEAETHPALAARRASLADGISGAGDGAAGAMMPWLDETSADTADGAAAEVPSDLL